MAIKSILTASVLSVIGAAVSTTAFADNLVNASTFCKPGFYAGVQGGRSDTFYNATNVPQPSLNAGSSATSQYDVNGNLSSYSTNVSTNTLSHKKVDDVGLGGRLYAGYQFNPYFALETGYTQYGKTEYNATNTNSSASYTYGVNNAHVAINPRYTGRTDSLTHYNGEITEHAIDLVGKATMPVPYGFGFYVKAGFAYIAADSYLNSTAGSSTTYNANNIRTGSVTATNAVRTAYTKSYQGFRPVAGIGVNYTIPNTNMSVTADYTRVFSYGGIPNAKLASLGLEYKFA